MIILARKVYIDSEEICKASKLFYNDMDGPVWRFTQNRVVHTSYKIGGATGFFFASVAYFIYRACNRKERNEFNNHQ